LNAEDSIENILNENQASAVVSKFIVGYIDNVMFLNGAGRIDKDTEFDPVRHRPEAEKEVPRGAKITRTLRAGVVFEDEVLRRAVVEVQESI